MQRAAGGAAGLRPLARRRPARERLARCGSCCPARRRWRPRWSRSSPSAPASRPPGLRADRGRAGGHQHAAARTPGARARSAPRCPASRSGWSTSPAGAVEGEDPGEIWVRGDNLFSGYWPDGAEGPDADGWWATGDVGFLDRRGDLFLVDRVKELVIVSGFNVYPVEVEEVVAEVTVSSTSPSSGSPTTSPARRSSPTWSADGDAAVARGRRARAVRAAAGAVQAAQPHRGGRRAALTRHRQGAEGPAARRPERRRARGCSSEPRVTARVTLYGRPGCHLCEEAREVVARVCAELGEASTRSTSTRDPALADASPRRCR